MLQVSSVLFFLIHPREVVLNVLAPEFSSAEAVTDVAGLKSSEKAAYYHIPVRRLVNRSSVRAACGPEVEQRITELYRCSYCSVNRA